MNSLSLPILRDTAEHMSVLSGILRTAPSDMKAHAIRKADKSLVVLEAFFGSNIAVEARQWKQAHDALSVLMERFEQISKIDRQCDSIREDMWKFEELNTKWGTQSADDRNRFLQYCKLAKQYLDTHTDINEAHIINRYQRLKALQPLLSYADNAEVLCEAIHHCENRERYEENIVKLKSKIETANIRLKSVTRGFYLAVCLCVLLVTLPLCMPFAMSLWNRRREINKQIANAKESIRREERRLQAADEGVIAQQDIREIAGNMPLEQVRRLLAEVKDLRAEFHGHQVASSQTANLVSFMENQKTRLEELFGPVELEPPHCFRWFVEKIQSAFQTQSQLELVQEKLFEAELRKKNILRGHSLAILEDSIARLSDLKASHFLIATEDNLKRELAINFIELPDVLRAVREALWCLSRCMPVDEMFWQNLQARLEAVTNVLNACLLNMELVEQWGQFLPADDDHEAEG